MIETAIDFHEQTPATDKFAMIVMDDHDVDLVSGGIAPVVAAGLITGGSFALGVGTSYAVNHWF